MKKIIYLFIIIAIFASLSNSTWAQSSDINAQILAKQKQLEEYNKKIEAYQKEIAEKQVQASSLKKQLNLLDNKISKAKLDLQANELNLNTVGLQIEALTFEINHKNTDIAQKRIRIAELLRQLQQSDSKGLLEVIVLNNSLSEFFEQLNYLETVQGELQSKVDDVETVKAELERQESELARYRSKLSRVRDQLAQSKEKLADEQDSKEVLLKQTKSSESQYQQLLAQVVQEQQKASADIKNLEAAARKKLKTSSGLEKLGDAVFIWPVNPYKGLSTKFYDPEYIFRKYFEHPGIDIPNSQGNAIKAAADGYVARAKDAGLGYSYIMLVHKNGFSTVYGHVSRIDVQEDTYVTKGQIIGAVGGLPGTRGAGKLTTGPHLHFELRSNGLPVNPMEYLP